MSTPTTRTAELALVGVLLGGCKPTTSAETQPIRIAAASDLSGAFEELGHTFERQHGQRVSFSFGSTGLLARQLREGAPFDLFAAANASFVDDVVAAGACDGATKAPYARGRVVLWTRAGHGAAPTELAALTDPRFARIAIANPQHAPYGQAAREALQHAGLWAALEPRLVLAENVRQALQFAQSGNADAALLALSLVANDRENPWLLVDESLHRPLAQTLVVCTHGHNRSGGAAFARYLASEPGRTVLRRYGFLLPGETPNRTP